LCSFASYVSRTGRRISDGRPSNRDEHTMWQINRDGQLTCQTVDRGWSLNHGEPHATRSRQFETLVAGRSHRLEALTEPRRSAVVHHVAHAVTTLKI